MKFGEDCGGGFDFFAMLEEQSAVLRVVEVLRDEGEGEAELRGLGSAHVDHAFVVDEVGEVVVEDVVGHLEAAPLHVGVEGAGEDVLEAVVFGAVVVAIDGAILGVDAAGPHHLLFDEGVLRHVDPDFCRAGWLGATSCICFSQ